MRHQAGCALFATMGMAAMLLFLPAGAHALPPTCQNVDGLVVAPGDSLLFPAAPCVDPDGDPFTLQAVDQPGLGELAAVPGGGYRYTADPDAHGVDQFTYRAVVATPPEESAPASVRILVDAAPVCADAAATVQSGQSLVLPDLPCTDGDDDPLSIYVLDDPQHGLLMFPSNGTAPTYTPTAGFVGTDTIPFLAEDDIFLRASEPRTLTITVTAVPQAPPPPPPPVVASTPRDTIPPQFDLRAVAVKPRTAARKGLEVEIDSQDAGAVAVTLSVDRATARRLGLARRPRRAVVVGRASRQATGATTLVVRMTAKARKAIRDARKVRILVTVVMTDAAGNRSTETSQVTLKR